MLSALLTTLSAEAGQKVHVVASGQRLGSIAKRYNVSIEDLCRANGISRRDPIKPGQKLIIITPGEDPAPPAASPKPASPSPAAPRTTAPTAAAKSAPATTKSTRAVGAPQTHIVQQGQTLGGIARRYGVEIDALCRASGITRRTKLRIGQRLVVPSPGDVDGEQARNYRVNGTLDRLSASRGGSRSVPRNYARAPSQRGYVTLVRYDRTWKGQVTGPRTGKLLPKARATISGLLGASSTGPQMDARLIQLLVKVSDHFGGRPLRVVSGMRDNSYFHDSKHPLGRALDFSIYGVPNEAVRDYCRTLGNVGVGYYPNSSFVHLDVRDRPTYWVDYAGPGEPPRSTPWAVARRPAQVATPAVTSTEPAANATTSAVPAIDTAGSPLGAAPAAGIASQVPPSQVAATPSAAPSSAAAAGSTTPTASAPTASPTTPSAGTAPPPAKQPAAPVKPTKPAPARSPLGAGGAAPAETPSSTPAQAE
jgi:LysM repeat protein